jgi:hypothetical protein
VYNVEGEVLKRRVHFRDLVAGGKIILELMMLGRSNQ